ncbi:S-type pyocin domain-containing protein [Streptomyces sp. NPDC059639]|uniref:S-type pyocin domain-containing protein n=1 Tax=Streptomyces sp. NPDC059639 TaxID=3346891 RepID=UPI003694C863
MNAVEQERNADNVIEFPRLEEYARPVEEDHAAEVSPTMVLTAEHGIINTGTVHGGQHVTTIGLPGRPGTGADDDC